MAALNGRLHLVCLVMASMWLPPYAAAADDEALAPAQPPAQHNALDQPQAQKLEKAVQALMAEAAQLQENQPKVKPRFDRPHPALADLGPRMARPVLDRMVEPFTGDEYGDTYVRWHLMELVKRARSADLSEMGKPLVTLMPAVPIQRMKKRDPTIIEGSQENHRRYMRLRNKTRATVGYPPFERVVYGRKALEHMPPQRRKEAERIVAEMEKLRSTFKQRRDPGVAAYNKRVGNIRKMVREYRGELVYTLVRTGDAKMARTMVGQIGKLVAKRQRAAMDMISYFYLAVFDGHLDGYDARTLGELSRQIEAIARSADEYAVYYDGNDRVRDAIVANERNFADFVFHLIHLLRDAEALRRMEEASNSIVHP